VKKYIIGIAIVCFGAIGFFIFHQSENEQQTVITSYGNWDGLMQICYTVEGSDGSFTVIDGGDEDFKEELLEILGNHGYKVDNWILTHPHPDHIGAFNSIITDAQYTLEIGNIYTTHIERNELLEKNTWDDHIEAYLEFEDIRANGVEMKELNEGDTLQLGDAVLKVYHGYSGMCYEQDWDIPNGCALMFKISGKEESMFFFTDEDSSYFVEDIVERYGDELKSDYIQCAHHGNCYDYSVYEPFEGSVFFIDAPEWLVTGEEYKTSTLIQQLREHGKTYYTFETAPNKIILK
jgi:ribonuclease BN (tRNA processing enzyme)